MANNDTMVRKLTVPILAATQEWPSPWFDRYGNDHMLRRVRAEAWSSVGGTLVLEQANDQGSPNTVASVTVTANAAAEIPWSKLTQRYYRLKYTNGAAAQTAPMTLYMEQAGRPIADVEVTGRNGATPVGTLQQITVDNTVKTLTPPPGATFATVSVETADIRFTKDGSTDPSTTVGQLLYVTDVLELESAAEIANFKFTRATATSGQITVSYGS